MKLGKILTTEILGVALLGLLCDFAKSDTTGPLCSSDSYEKSDLYAFSVSYVLADLKAETSKVQAFDYYSASATPSPMAYGHAKCSTTLTESGCKRCLQTAKDLLLSSCKRRVGAELTIDGCRIRYENYPFMEDSSDIDIRSERE